MKSLLPITIIALGPPLAGIAVSAVATVLRLAYGRRKVSLFGLSREPFWGSLFSPRSPQSKPSEQR